MPNITGDYRDIADTNLALGEAQAAVRLYAAIALSQQQAIAIAQQNQQIPQHVVSPQLLGLISDPSSPFAFGLLFKAQIEMTSQALLPSAVTVASVSSPVTSHPVPPVSPDPIAIPRSIQMASGFQPPPISKRRTSWGGLFKFLSFCGLLAIAISFLPSPSSLRGVFSSFVTPQGKTTGSSPPASPKVQASPPASINDSLGELAAPVAPVGP